MWDSLLLTVGLLQCLVTPYLQVPLSTVFRIESNWHSTHFWSDFIVISQPVFETTSKPFSGLTTLRHPISLLFFTLQCKTSDSSIGCLRVSQSPPFTCIRLNHTFTGVDMKSYRFDSDFHIWSTQHLHVSLLYFTFLIYFSVHNFITSQLDFSR